ncbi:hypothetical protein B0H16DRAFT_1556883, partial [Mycena metata]
MSSPQDHSGDASVDRSPFNTPSSDYREELSIAKIPPIRIPPSSPNAPSTPRTMKGNLTVREAMKSSAHKPKAPGAEKNWMEFRGGDGPPSGGDIGDVFWGTTPPFIFYVRRPNPDGDLQWTPWNPDPSKAQLLATHPLLENRYLWISGTTSLSCNWVTSGSLRNKGINVVKYMWDQWTSPQDALTLPKDVASESPRRLENLAGQSNNSDGSMKRKRSYDDEDEQGRPMRPQVLDDIPQALTQMASIYSQNVAQVQALFTQTAASTNALLPAIRHIVSEERRVLAGSAVEVGQLRVENEQLKLAIAAKDATIQELQTRTATREKEAVTVRETLGKELEAAKQRVEMSTNALLRIFRILIFVVAAENSEIITQLEAKLHHEELANLEARERYDAKIIEFQRVSSDFASSIQSQFAGHFAQLERGKDFHM